MSIGVSMRRGFNNHNWTRVAQKDQDESMVENIFRISKGMAGHVFK